MKIPYSKLCLVFIIQLSALSQTTAQTKTATLLPPPKNIAIDGDIKEWGDSLRYYNTEKQINYAIANDKDNLYLAVRIEDRREQNKILKAGITFSIDPKGRKKETYSITFPLNVQGGTPSLNIKSQDNGEITQQERDELAQERLTTLRGIKVEGFKDVEGDMITTSNTYGFKTAVNYDDKGYLVCEALIPLSFFHVDDATKSEWAFNIKINGVKRAAPDGEDPALQNQATGRGGRGGGMGGGGGRHGGGGRGGANHSGLGEDQTEMYKSTDFWEKFYLAKN